MLKIICSIANLVLVLSLWIVAYLVLTTEITPKMIIAAILLTQIAHNVEKHNENH